MSLTLGILGAHPYGAETPPQKVAAHGQDDPDDTKQACTEPDAADMASKIKADWRQCQDVDAFAKLAGFNDKSSEQFRSKFNMFRTDDNLGFIE